MKQAALAFGVALILIDAGMAHAGSVADAIGAAISSPNRPAADKARDALRKPGEVIAFSGLKPGDKIADLVPGAGYYTRVFSGVVGSAGHVYAIVPAEFLKIKPTGADGVKAIAADPAYKNVELVEAPTGSVAASAPVDVAWTSDNYHDIYGFFGAGQAAAFDAAVYRMLRPGGVFMVIDHIAKAGTSATNTTTLHRIDPETVKAQVLAAGFHLADESPLLNNPADTHEEKVFAPSVKGRTDQFIMKFVKPGS